MTLPAGVGRIGFVHLVLAPLPLHLWFRLLHLQHAHHLQCLGSERPKVDIEIDLLGHRRQQVRHEVLLERDLEVLHLSRLKGAQGQPQKLWCQAICSA